MSKKKILIPIGGYFPATESGGPAVSIENFCELLGEEYQCCILTNTRMDEETAKEYGISEKWVSRGKSEVYYLPMHHMKLKYMEKIVKELMPEVIYLQSLFNAKFTIPCLIIARKYSVKTILATRGELYPEALDKKYKKIPYIIFLRIFGLLKNIFYQATSVEEEQYIQQHLGASANKIEMIRNIPTFVVNKFERKKEKGYVKLGYIARISEHKNLELALECLGKVKGNVEYHIYGVMESEAYWERCQKIIQRLPPNIKITYHGGIEHSEVTVALKDVHGVFLPTRHENFGHAIVEAMLNSCPVIISNQTPWLDLNEEKVGWVCDLYKTEEFIRALQEFIDMEQGTYDELVERLQNYAKNLFDVEEIRQKYKTFIDKVLK